jgi:anaerobic ribonucleoside-triphosphate reductase activating protein
MIVNNVVCLSEILEIAERSKRDYEIEGATLIGGEPTLQASLDALARGLRSLGLGVILFTGRDFEELEEHLVRELDLVIDGRYQSDNKDTERNLIGSTNQRIIEVTDRYHDSLDWFLNRRPDYVEIDVKDGFLISNGNNFRLR